VRVCDGGGGGGGGKKGAGAWPTTIIGTARRGVRVGTRTHLVGTLSIRRVLAKEREDADHERVQHETVDDPHAGQACVCGVQHVTIVTQHTAHSTQHTQRCA